MSRTVEQIQFAPRMPKPLRVAAYARVSSGKDAMLHSLAAQVDHYSVPFHTVATLNKHIYYYLNDWLNIPVEEPSEETMQAVSDSPEFQAMPLYPAQGSVQVLDGRVVVRMQETYTPKSDYEIAFENRR